MAGPTSAAERQQPRQQGWIARLITLPFRLFGVLCGSLLLSILIECVGMVLIWPEQSWHHAEGMLNYEISQLSSNFKQSILVNEPARTAQRVISRTYDSLFIRTGILQWSSKRSAEAHSQKRSTGGGSQHLLSLVYVHVEAYVIAAAYTLLTFLVRLLILVLTFPLFFIAVVVGLTDGLVRRDLRRFGAGHESGFLFHRAKATIGPLAWCPLLLYLALPVSIHPLFILLPGAILLGTAVNITTGSFKKYL